MDFFYSPKFSSRVEELMKQYHVPGLAIAIVQNETIASAGYGKASLDPSKPCTPDTLFDTASVGKSLTGASVGLLVNDNERYPEVQYEATMSSLLPDDFVMSGEGYTEGVTVEDILSHRTGLPAHDFSYRSQRAAQPDNPRSITRNLRNLPVATPIRSKHMYNNMMFTVATHLVEKKTGISYSDFLHERFFGPLDMHSTNLQPERARAKGLGDRIATGYFWDEKAQKYQGFQTPDCPEAQGAGCIITSVNDYIKWVKALMNHEDPVTEEVYKGIVRSRSFENPDEKHLPPFTSPRAYGAGLGTFFYRGHKIVSHAGLVAGFGSWHFFLPDVKFGGVIFGNSGDGEPVASILGQELIDEVLRVPEAERPDRNKLESGDNLDDPEKDLREKLCPGIKESQPQKMPLSAYTGEYWNPGYRDITVQIKNDKLFIDATDRSMGFTLTLDHIGEQTKYIAHMSDFWEGGDVPLMAEFRFDNDRTVKMGLQLEEEEDYQELIWFNRVINDQTGKQSGNEGPIC
ncbi:hypothetical protein Plec18167_008566 [Paecilomyces lecythidis]|uniref:Beta-lactamase family protein n=1 Tax=Paecilomyces lecythidis TaxID=3004212 RepID=A0ABR3WVU9_9EURO